MNLGDHLSFGAAGLQDFLTWLLLLSMCAKVASTALLLVHRHARPIGLVTPHERGLWWTTKLTALALCASAACLCRIAGDATGAAAFGTLFLVACAVTLRMAGRRKPTHPTSPETTTAP